jgi:hypothetical protein
VQGVEEDERGGEPRRLRRIEEGRGDRGVEGHGEQAVRLGLRVASLALTCPSCSFSNEPGEKFCGGCGQPLRASESAAKFTPPESYTPKHLAEKIVTSRAALEGERKQVIMALFPRAASSRAARFWTRRRAGISPAPFGRVPDGVIEQVEEELLDQLGINRDERQVRRKSGLDGPILEWALQTLERRAEDPVERLPLLADA